MEGRMKILLVRPPRIKQAITLGNFMFSEPLGLEMIRKYGFRNMLRVVLGTLGASVKYVKLMIGDRPPQKPQ